MLVKVCTWSCVEIRMQDEVIIYDIGNSSFESVKHFMHFGKSVTNQNSIPEDINPLTHNDGYSGRTAPLTSKCCILCIYSTNTGTEYFKLDIYCPFFLFKMQFVS